MEARPGVVCWPGRGAYEMSLPARHEPAKEQCCYSITNAHTQLRKPSNLRATGSGDAKSEHRYLSHGICLRTLFLVAAHARCRRPGSQESDETIRVIEEDKVEP
jgi:hypothetical protein